ncbi:uncharacterized protein LOC126838581 [Adelges cooleyi]|uniref:uncharacterized protein LOC126838581 n=1 Tax=Adelges cooleyi TaxID=133065 RepID=UPI00217F2BBE|nr:uncharacterized protein LOC126838581 [Adelges cooleyi]
MYRLIFVFLAVTSVRSAIITLNVNTQSGDNPNVISNSDPNNVIMYAEAQKAAFTIKYNYADSHLEVRDSFLSFGKWTDGKCNELTSPNGSKISKDNPLTVRACGREHSPSGVTGYLFLRKQGETENDYKLTFDVPWGAGANKFVLTALKEEPVISCELAPDSGSSMVNKAIRCFRVQ